MTVEEIEQLFYKEIPGSIVHVLEPEKRCFQVIALFEAKTKKDAFQRAMSFLAASHTDLVAVSLIWHGSDYVCAFDPLAPKPLTWEEEFTRSLGRFSSGNSNDWSDDDWDDDRSPNWPSTTGNPSGGGRDNNPPRR